MSQCFYSHKTNAEVVFLSHKPDMYSIDLQMYLSDSKPGRADVSMQYFLLLQLFRF